MLNGIVRNFATSLAPTNKDNTTQFISTSKGSTIDRVSTNNSRAIKRVGDNNYKVDEVGIIDTTNPRI